MAERSCQLLARDRGWQLSYDFPPVAPKIEVASRPGMLFTEGMKGYVSTSVTDDYERDSNKASKKDSWDAAS